MKVDTLTLMRNIEADGVFTDKQAARLVYLLQSLGVIEHGAADAPSFPPPIQRPSKPGTELAHLEGLWWECDEGPGNGPGYSRLMLVPGGFVVLTSRAGSDGGALAQAFVPCDRNDAVRIIKRRSRRFASAVEGAGEET